MQMTEQLRGEHVAILVQRFLIRCAVVTLLRAGRGSVRRHRLGDDRR